MECLQMAQHGSVVIAETQTAGRGRRGRTWVSPAGNNVYCSIGLNKAIDAEYMGMISLQVGVCIAQVLLGEGYSGLSLKWPNDILLQGKKLGGILIESRFNTANEFYLVIGFGLNTCLQESVTSQIDRPAIGLNQVSDSGVNRQRLFPELIGSIYDAVNAFQISGIPALIRRFSDLDSYLGKKVSIVSGEEITSGIYQGLEKTGQIQIRTKRGLELFSAAEISLRDPEHVAD
jgi:BirA family biotin operon repressor/biotin-[acetyl-CoA-carboxylase] ligase